MNLKFRHKLFLAFLLNSLIIIGCLLLIGRYYSERHFSAYVGKVEAERITKIVDVLGQEYIRRGNWNSFLREPEFTFGLGVPGPGMGAGIIVSQMLIHRSSPFEREKEPPPPGPPPPGPPPAGPSPGHLRVPPFVLFDAEKQPLNVSADSISQKDYKLTAVLADGRTVGWLGTRKLEPPTHHLDVEFMKRQARTLYTLGAVVLILAVIVTSVLSRLLLAPVKELEEGTKALSSRRFDARIAVRSNDELGQLAAGFNSMAQALEKHQQTQQQWLVDISHELRTPLAILRGEIEALQDGIRTVTKQGLDSLHTEVLHLSRIVSDLHDLSLIESRSFSADLSALNPVEIMNQALECFRTRLNRRGITLELDKKIEEDILILADAGRLKQLFSNLFENSLRYASAPGVLKIFCRAAKNELYVSCEDSGPGVPEESLPLLFDRLYRVDRARSRENGGSGLGLAICKSIVEGFGGKIEASNSPDAGLKISMSFPRYSGKGDSR